MIHSQKKEETVGVPVESTGVVGGFVSSLVPNGMGLWQQHFQSILKTRLRAKKLLHEGEGGRKKEAPDPWGNPLVHCGMRFDYLYLICVISDAVGHKMLRVFRNLCLTF